MNNFCVFLDRDGVINEVVWRDGKPASPRTLSELVLVPDLKSSLNQLKAAGARLFVVTNQPDIARGRMALGALEEMHAWLMDVLPLDGISACLHDNDDNCHCRKPKPGMIVDLARDHGLDLSKAWMIGDQARDVACAREAGCASILVARDYNTGIGADHIVAGVSDAVALITHQIHQTKREFL